MQKIIQKIACLWLAVLSTAMSFAGCASPAATPPASLFDKTYAFDECLYMSPLSSSYAIEGTGLLYGVTRDCLTFMDADTGDVRESHCGEAQSYTKVTKKSWEGRFIITEPVDISAYKSKYQYDIADIYRLYVMDDQVWLGQLAQDGTLWSLYRLKVAAPTQE